MVNSLNEYGKAAILVAIVLGLIPALSIYISLSSPTKIKFTDHHIHIEGGFGVSIPLANIDKVQLINWQDLPSTAKRKKASSTRNHKKGLFIDHYGVDVYVFVDNLKPDQILHISCSNMPDLYYANADGDHIAAYNNLNSILVTENL